jgi:hypothetical protein
MQRHPNKEIREAVEYAIEKGWSIKEASGHAWGIMYCPHNDSSYRGRIHCKTSIYSTPKNPSNTARQLKRIVKNCIYFQE